MKWAVLPRILSLLILIGCAPATPPAPSATLAPPTQPVATATAAPTVAPAPKPTTAPATAVPSATPTPAPPTITKIKVDGDASDWAGREALQNTWGGKAEAGFLDLTDGYTFVNQHALYLLVKTVDPKATSVQFDMTFQADANRLLLSWSPGQTRGSMGDVTSGFKSIGPTAHSSFAFGPALEARVDLRDLGAPKSVRVMSIKVMVGQCCNAPAWRAADQWQPASTPVVDEIDSPRVVSDEPPYVLARRWQLPEGYVAKRLFAPAAPDLNAITRSRNGTIYLQHIKLSSGLSTLDPVTGKVTRILDLPPEGASYITGGPEDTAFLNVRGEVWQVRPDGTHSVWLQNPDGAPRYYTSDNRLLAISHDGTRVLQLLPGGGSREIASGFAKTYDVVAAPDGTVFVSDWETGDITRVDPGGAKRVLVQHVLYRDPLDLEVDSGGHLFLNDVVTGLVQVDSDTGALTRYDRAESPCTVHPADFVFTASGRALFMDPTLSQVTFADLGSKESGLLVSNQGANTWAAAIGPDDALYVGVWGCGDEIPAQVARIDDDGTRQIYVDGLRGEVRDIAFAPDGGLYVAAFVRGQGLLLYYVPPQSGAAVQIPGTTGMGIVSIAVDPPTGHLLASEFSGSAILEFTRDGLLTKHPIKLPKDVFDFQIDVAPDGTLYAYCSEQERQQTGPVVERWVLQIDWKSGSSKVVGQIDRQGCCVMGNLNVDSHNSIWWLLDPEFRIYRVTPDGKISLFAQDLPIDPAGIAADRQGDVYFTSPGGIYRIYRAP